MFKKPIVAKNLLQAFFFYFIEHIKQIYKFTLAPLPEEGYQNKNQESSIIKNFFVKKMTELSAMNYNYYSIKSYQWKCDLSS